MYKRVNQRIQAAQATTTLSIRQTGLAARPVTTQQEALLVHHFSLDEAAH